MIDPPVATVLLIPGFGDRSTSWRRLAEGDPLAPHRFDVVDLPGIGGGAALPTVTMAAFADYVAARVDREVRPVVLVGHSLGSALAVAAAAGRPAAVAGVLSIEGNLTADDGYFSATAARHDDAMSFLAALTSQVRELVVRGEAPPSFLDSVTAADPMTLWALGRDSAQHGVGDGFGQAYRALEKPKRYLWSARSTPEETQRYLRAHHLDAVELPGGGHWPLEIAEHWTIERIREFVSEQCPWE